MVFIVISVIVKIDIVIVIFMVIELYINGNVYEINVNFKIFKVINKWFFF